jgi:hypothetical protein
MVFWVSAVASSRASRNLMKLLYSIRYISSLFQVGAAHNCSLIGMENHSNIFSTKERDFQAS